MGTAIPKQFLELKGKPVLYHCLRNFLDTVPDIQIVLVLPEEQISWAQMLLQHFPERIDLTIVPGGPTRFHSVQNGLKGIPDDAVILVHDGVRPFPGQALIRRCIDTALQSGSAIPCIPVTDSIRMLQDNNGSVPVDRDQLRSIQTPQAFKAALLLPAFTQEYNTAFTDEATVAEAYGIRITLVPGEKNNLKITTPEDLVWAELLPELP